MTATHNTFLMYAGDTWEFDAILHDNNGVVLPLTGAEIVWRLRNGAAVLIERTVGNGIVINDAANGVCTITVMPNQTAAIAVGNYTDEIIVTMPDGFVSTQAVGPIVVAKHGESVATPLEADNPCAVLAALQAARMSLLLGQRETRVKVEGFEVSYAVGDAASLDAAITRYDALCSKSKNKGARRFAIRGVMKTGSDIR